MKKIFWLIPSLISGSGGHRTILQHANRLNQNSDKKCYLLIEDNGRTVEQNKKLIKEFGYEFENIQKGWEITSVPDMVIATIWYSARFAANIPFECKKVYFVQDYEAYFMPVGDGFLMAENSYKYDLQVISIGNWLKYKLLNFDKKVLNFDFCANKNIYKPLQSLEKVDNSICFIYQPEKDRRCPDLGIEALGIVKHFMPEVKIFLFGSTTKGNVWFDHINYGLVTIEECNEIYNKSTLGLCISSTNPSRIPFEMMASGLPVIEIDRENNYYDMPDSAIQLCEPSPESIAEGIMALLKDKKRLKSMSESGIRYMKSKPIELETEQFEEYINKLIENVDINSLYQEPIKINNGKVITSKNKFEDVIKPQSKNLKGKLKKVVKRFLG